MTIATYHSFVPAQASKYDDSLQYRISDSSGAKLNFNTLFGDYSISSQNFSGQNNLLMDGSYQSDRLLLVTTGFDDSKIPYISFQEDSNWNILQDLYSNLNISLNSNILLSLYFKNFWGKDVFDLSQLARKDLSIQGAVNDMDIAL
ncbi:MAG: hypothetical protein GXP45_02345 [bacterium]|nr:hypothetical protein [bacterium]